MLVSPAMVVALASPAVVVVWVSCVSVAVVPDPANLVAAVDHVELSCRICDVSKPLMLIF